VYIGFNVVAHASERVQIFGRENAGVDSTAARAATVIARTSSERPSGDARPRKRRRFFHEETFGAESGVEVRQSTKPPL
jgi:hypothetical protein